MELRGVFPVLPTPFDELGRVDGTAVRQLVEFVLACGAHGITYPGVASEFDYLSAQERDETLREIVPCDEDWM